MSTDDDAPPREAVLFLQRTEHRAKSAGKAAGLCTLGLVVFVLATMGLDNCGGWSIFGVGTVVTFGILARRAVRESAADFQHTFRRPGMDAERRESVLDYLWKKAHPVAGAAGASKAAKDLLNELGIKVQPKAVHGHLREALVSVEPPLTEPAAPVERAEVPPPYLPPPPPPPPPAKPAPVTAAPAPPAHAPRPPARAPSAWNPQRPAAPPRPRVAHVPHKPHVPPAPHVPHALPPPATPAAAPAASLPSQAPPASVGAPPETTVTCPSCGTARTVLRGESASLCPVCFPQIRLEP